MGQGGEVFEEWLELRNGCLCCSVKYDAAPADGPCGRPPPSVGTSPLTGWISYARELQTAGILGSKPSKTSCKRAGSLTTFCSRRRALPIPGPLHTCSGWTRLCAPPSILTVPVLALIVDCGLLAVTGSSLTPQGL